RDEFDSKTARTIEEACRALLFLDPNRLRSWCPDFEIDRRGVAGEAGGSRRIGGVDPVKFETALDP
ncbi:MAG: hypothetical protein EBY07_17500, partial [Actinobacteria bacterium]|nr:hypothetical protein [Actinomycetota bacterium]